MTPHEVCMLIGHDGEVLWCDESNSPARMPDSRSRWQAIWRLRDVLEEVAHSHPDGPLGFSTEDESTMSALTSALGKPLRFSVVAPEGMVSRQGDRDVLVVDEPWWAEALRSASGIRHNPGGLA